MEMKMFLSFFVVCGSLMLNVNAANILAVFEFPGRSHWMMINTVIKELASRGHNLTVISNYPNKPKIENITEITIAPIYDFWSFAVDTENLFELTEMSFWGMMDMLNNIGIGSSEYAFNRENVQEFILHDNQTFDLILAEQFYQESFLMFAHKYKAPIVTIGTFGFAHYFYPMFGILAPWSHMPHAFLPYTDSMSFLQRVHNFLGSAFEDFYRQHYYLPQQEKMAKKYFSHLEHPLPTVNELERKVSAILLNSYVPLTSPRPSIKGMIEVGGLHIRDPKPLDTDLKEFLDGAVDGAIYFSLGTNLKSSEMPPEKLKVFLKVFADLKLRVLWKFEDEKMVNLPKNVLIKSWMPQSDILAHPNVKVFITHGGLLGTQEGVFHAVPMLGIPIYCDQHLNMNKAKLAGYAIPLYFPNITEVSLKWALNELLYNPVYLTKMNEISEIFRDRPVPALEEAIYWIEYVIKYKGAPQIRSAGLQMSWFSMTSLDVIAFLATIFLITFYFLIKIVKTIVFRNVSIHPFLFRSRKHNKIE